VKVSREMEETDFDARTMASAPTTDSPLDAVFSLRNWSYTRM
jgi:hypothetical protein